MKVWFILTKHFDSLLFDPASPILLTLQSDMPSSKELVADFNPRPAVRKERLTRFLRERVFNTNMSIYAFVPLNKRLTFAKPRGTKKPVEELKATAAEMERARQGSTWLRLAKLWTLFSFF